MEVHLAAERRYEEEDEVCLRSICLKPYNSKIAYFFHAIIGHQDNSRLLWYQISFTEETRFFMIFCLAKK